MSNEKRYPDHIIGIGFHRVFSIRISRAVTEVLEGPRSIISNGVSLQPRYNHEKARQMGLGFKDAEAWDFPNIVGSKEEIVEAIEQRWEHVAYISSHQTDLLIDAFGTKERALEFCYNTLVNEMNLLRMLHPHTPESVEIETRQLSEQRAKAIEDKCDEYKARDEHEVKIRQLVADDDIDGLVGLVGERVLAGRIGRSVYQKRSDLSWDDIRMVYRLSNAQLKRFRSSKGYHELLAAKCIERVKEHEKRRARNYPNDPPFVPDAWYNETLIKKAGAIGFVEPEYN